MNITQSKQVVLPKALSLHFVYVTFIGIIVILLPAGGVGWLSMINSIYIAFVIFFSMMYILWYKVIKHDNPYGRHVNMNQEQKDIDEYNSHENEGLKPVDTYSVPMIELKNISYLENLGAAMERFLQRNFTRWGTCCARHPIISPRM
jgi:hypothetical protein